ncbi:MAG TPA: hypothetical protein VHU44_06180 [Acidobacteriaceae bacterium]|jgi:hypothetical protein|nr:hypothetical protein [Acidobacteriaceae bacterium]
MNAQQFVESLKNVDPPLGLTPPVEALWWDGKGEWARAHELVNDVETPDAMAVHAYLHRKEGEESNANYWYRRAGEKFRRSSLDEEWKALMAGLLP